MDSHLTLLLINIFLITISLSWFYFYIMSMIRAIMDFNDEILSMVQKQQGIENQTEYHGKTLYDYIKKEEEEWQWWNYKVRIFGGQLSALSHYNLWRLFGVWCLTFLTLRISEYFLLFAPFISFLCMRGMKSIVRLLKTLNLWGGLIEDTQSRRLTDANYRAILERWWTA